MKHISTPKNTRIVLNTPYCGCLVTDTEVKQSQVVTNDLKIPRIPLPEWRKMAAFFHKIWKDHSSEAQVRLYVHPEIREFRAWAHPQIVGTGMISKEDPNHAQFSHVPFRVADPRWRQWGTNHSHCSMSAFQSGTDLADEEGVDGVHITIGCLGSPKLSIHNRLYIDRNKFELEWSELFDSPAIAPPEGLPPALFQKVLASNELMEWFITSPVQEAEYSLIPQEWLDNCKVEVRTNLPTRYGGHGVTTYNPGQSDFNFKGYPRERRKGKGGKTGKDSFFSAGGIEYGDGLEPDELRGELEGSHDDWTAEHYQYKPGAQSAAESLDIVSVTRKYLERNLSLSQAGFVNQCLASQEATDIVYQLIEAGVRLSNLLEDPQDWETSIEEDSLINELVNDLKPAP